ncbi:hypothetical protein O181_042950 [Austropuccinia psidii MF-1]|uniref:Retrotransposon gag domain-containing protein n=1 Tax=Austropuccinia psidii MF-1 TaxID=1389203 RepID=A0A9Q3DHJ5_9BASI|nr:hypothetical protein [Austropuccinia psidii MF-1]
MPAQNSPPDENTRSKRHRAVLTPTARAPLDLTPSVHQLSANLDRGPQIKGEAPFRRGSVKSIRSISFSVLLSGYPSISKGPRRRSGGGVQRNGSSSCLGRDTSRAPAFKTPSMKEPDSFDGTKSYKLRGFIQSCQLIFHNDPANCFPERKKVLYSTSFLTGRPGKWIEPYLSNISNENPSYLLNNWKLFETQLFTLFGDPNEVRKSEQELKNLIMKKGLQELVDITLELGTRYNERKKEKGSHQEKKPQISGSNSFKPLQGLCEP